MLLFAGLRQGWKPEGTRRCLVARSRRLWRDDSPAPSGGRPVWLLRLDAGRAACELTTFVAAGAADRDRVAAWEQGCRNGTRETQAGAWLGNLRPAPPWLDRIGRPRPCRDRPANHIGIACPDRVLSYRHGILAPARSGSDGGADGDSREHEAGAGRRQRRQRATAKGRRGKRRLGSRGTGRRRS